MSDLLLKAIEYSSPFFNLKMTLINLPINLFLSSTNNVGFFSSLNKSAIHKVDFKHIF